MEEKQPEDKIIYRLMCLQTVLQQDVLDESRDEFSSEKVKAFVKCVRRFARVHTEAFMLLCADNNYTAAFHFFRLITDCTLRVYAATLFKGERLERYIDNFFKGKEPDKTKYKGKFLYTSYIKELMLQEVAQERQEIAQKAEDIDRHWLEICLDFKDMGNQSTHFTSFYADDLEEWLNDKAKMYMIGTYTQLLVFMVSLLSRLK